MFDFNWDNNRVETYMQKFYNYVHKNDAYLDKVDGGNIIYDRIKGIMCLLIHGGSDKDEEENIRGEVIDYLNTWYDNKKYEGGGEKINDENYKIIWDKIIEKFNSKDQGDVADFNIFKDCLKNSKFGIDTWLTDSQYQNKKIDSLKSDLVKFNKYLENDCSTKENYLWNKIYLWLEKNLKDECIEYIVSMMMEPYDSIINPLVNNMSSEEEEYFNIPADRKIYELI